MTKPSVLVVFGTRPEAIKLAPVVRALRERGAEVVPLITGQHRDLLDAEVMASMGQVLNLECAADTVLSFLTRARRKLHDALAEAGKKPDAVMVQGDTMSAFVGAIVASALGIRVAHIEAGVRSHSTTDPWPEELIRVEIDRIATWRYAPTSRARGNLRSEGINDTDVVVTGNTSIDALHAAGVTPREESTPPYVLVTLHRREFRQRADALSVMQAVCDAAHETRTRVIWPVHPAMVTLANQLRLPYEVHARPPMSHALMLEMLMGARGVLTDSGGLVEEAAALGVPTAVLRFHSDRPEAEAAGIARRFDPTPEGARAAITILAQDAIPRVPSACFGDGRASDRIAAHLMQVLG